MAEEFAIGRRIQAVDELGRWSAARIVEICNDAERTVSFVGYPGCDRTVNLEEIRSPVAPLAEQERRNGFTCDRRQLNLITPNHRRFINESQRGDEVETTYGKGVVEVVDPYNKTFDLADGSTVNLCDLVFPVDEIEIEAPPVKRRRRMSTTAANVSRSDTLSSPQDQESSSCPELGSSSRLDINPLKWSSFCVGNFQCGKLYEVKGLGLTVVPHALNLTDKTATCWLIVADDVDREAILTLPIDRLTDTKSTTVKGPLKKKLVSITKEAYCAFSPNLADAGFRAEFRRSQLLGALKVELAAAFRSRMRKKNFDFGFFSIENDNRILNLDVPTSWSVDFGYKKKNLSRLDDFLGPRWDICTREGLTRFVTYIKFKVSTEFILTGMIKVADFDSEVPETNYRELLKRHMNHEEEAATAESN